MSDKGSEEKSQPGSEKKIRDSRKKGQVAKSQDMITALVVLACTVYLGFAASDVTASVNALFDEVASTLMKKDLIFSESWPVLVAKAVDVLMSATFPLLAVIIFVVVMGNLIIMKGFLFSTDPIKPDVNRLNPVDGFKRLFSARNVVEFLKSIFKVIVLGAALIVVYRNSLPYLLGTPTCGAPCIFASFKLLFIPITITAVLAFFLSGLIDLLLQRWLFAREMRMSHSEVKRERKDIEGSPEIRKERNRLRHALQASSSARGANMASVMIGAPGSWTVGLRYVRGETKVPVVVFVAAADKAQEVWTPENRSNIPHVYDPALSRDIAQRSRIGEALPDLFFERIARILVKEGLI